MEHDYYYFLGSADDDNYYESNLHIDQKFENFLESIDFNIFLGLFFLHPLYQYLYGDQFV